jgi:hypothetical protein
MKYKEDALIRKNAIYKDKKEFVDSDKLKYDNEKHEKHDKKDFLKSRLEYCEKIFKKNHSFQLDLFQLIDYEFVNWANSQTETHVIAVMAEMKKSPKLKPEIEVLRKDVAHIPLLSIDEYRKIKRLGVRTVSFLHKMKQQYGNNVLKILYLTSNSL